MVVAVVAWQAACAVVAAEPLPPGMFVNPIAEGADPCVIKEGESYLWCMSENNLGVSIWVSDRPNSLGRRHVIWRAPSEGPVSKQVWAPELVKLDDRFYVYFAASDGQNRNHRTYVLQSRTADPVGEYTLHGPLYTGDSFETGQDNIWAIDMTVLEHGGKRFALWSGWDTADSDRQYLYIAPMNSPIELAGSRIRMCGNDDHLWERIEEKAGTRGLHEAPQVLQRGGRTFVVYSCAASWLPTYKLGLLELTGDDPLDPSSWKKFPEPVFQSTEQTFGVGHGSFVRSPDETEWWHVFHAKRDRGAGWRRTVFVQPMQWTQEGLPDFGRPVEAGKPLQWPSGTPGRPITGPQTWDFSDPSTQAMLDYYGHHGLLSGRADGLVIGGEPKRVVNGYQCGEKLIVRDTEYADLLLTAKFRFLDGERDAGILFRTTGPAVGYDAQRGYFAGLIPGRGTVILGKMDGSEWHHLADAKVGIDQAKAQQLSVRAVGEQIEVFVNGADQPAISLRDGDYPKGAVGVRVVDTRALFESLSVARP
jgi:GH43 family beta-xylosidase